jgi:tetratricopeptide (TPR) repeat protein
MRLGPASRVDENLGYEVCRFGGVRAFILPRIRAAGQAYELEAILIDPLRRRHGARIEVKSKGREDVLLKGVDELSREVRSRLGESLSSIEKAAVSVAKVTTSSWEALDYYSMAQASRDATKYKEAAALYQLALEQDPHFFAAQGALGLIQVQFQDQAERGKEMLRGALREAQSQGAPESEIQGFKALNRQFVDGDLEGALAEFRTMMNLTTQRLKGRPPKAEDWLAFAGLAAVGGDTDRALIYIDRAAPAGIKDADSLMDLAQIYALLGRPGPAIEHIKKSLAAGYSDHFFPVILPEFQVLRKNPEFRALFKLGV